MTRPPAFDDLFAVMAAASVGDPATRVELPEHPDPEDPATRLAIALNLLLDDLAFRTEALRASEENLAITLHSIGDGVIATDTHGRVVRMNAVAEELTGWSLRDASGLPLDTVFVIVSEITRLTVENPVTRVLREGTVVGLANHTVLVARDGRERPIADSGAPIRGRDGVIRGVVLVFRDMTQEHAAELARDRMRAAEDETRRLQEANRLKGEFLAQMSHELRTPLNAIIGFTEVVHDGHAGPIHPDQAEFLDHVLSASRHLLRLINEVLDLSKVESGRVELRPEIVDVERLVGEVMDVLQPLRDARRVQVEATVAPEVREVVMDPSRLRQILYNYISNALKFTPVGGSAWVRVLAQGPESFLIEVEDTGRGIAETDLPRLFREFEQLETGTAAPREGTGLGLAITRRLVEVHGGRVGVTSTLGKGTCFTAVLPRRSLQER